jgi:hypothetical protein
LSRRAESLRAQHAELFSELCRLAERSEQLPYEKSPARLMSSLSEGFFHFADNLQEHEARESDLILEAMNQDIGTGD